MPHTDIMAPPSATRAGDAASHTSATVDAAKKSSASASTKELLPTPGEETDNSVVTPLPTIDLSSLEGGPSFSSAAPAITKTKAENSATTSTLPVQVKAGNIPRKQVPVPAQAPAPVQPFTFGQPAKPTGIRYPPGLNPSTVVSRPVARPPRQNSAASPPFVPAAPPSALSPQAVTSPSLPIPNSREFTFNVPSTSSTLSPPVTPSFPDSTEAAKTMFLTASHRKRNMAMTPAVSEYEADLTSKDRMKQKEAVKKILAAKVRSDWAENWVDTVPEVKEVLKPVGDEEDAPKLGGDGETEEKWVERSEWLSELSSSEDEEAPVSPPLVRVPTTEERPSFLRRLSSSGKGHADPFRFENPDSVGEVLKRKTERKKVRRQRRFVDELKENEGLRCFTARRNIWTGAKIVRRPVTSRPTSKASASGSAKMAEELPKVEEVTGESAEVAAAQPTNGTSTSPEAAKEEKEKDEWDDVILDTLIPIPPPLLPPSTPMRKNVTSRNYTTIYDKIILGGQTPLCPINLQTVVSSCVEGWKRDGEWPPRSTVENDALMSRKKVVGEAKKPRDGGPGWRRSLQKVFGGRADGPI